MKKIFFIFGLLFICHFAYGQEANSNIRTLLSSEGKVLFGNEPNSIMVIDYPENIQRVAEYLENMDISPRQVLIEARVVEVKLQKEHALGVNWKAFADKGYFTLGRFKSGASSTLGAMPGPPQQTIAYKPTFYPPGQITSGQESPFTYAIFDDNINIILQTLASELDTSILSAPSVATVNSRQAQINVIQRLPWAEPTITPSETQGVAPSISYVTHYEEVGIKLKVTPIINSDSKITMILEPEISEKTSDYPVTASSGGTSVTYNIPIIDSRNASTKVVVGDGQTLIIGGLIKDKTTKGSSKVPLLGDLPYLGYLFKSIKDTQDKIELLIFVSPKLITADEFVRMAKQEKETTDKNYIKERQRQQELTLKTEEEKTVKDARLSAKFDLLTEKQAALAEEKKELKNRIVMEGLSLKALQEALKR